MLYDYFMFVVVFTGESGEIQPSNQGYSSVQESVGVVNALTYQYWCFTGLPQYYTGLGMYWVYHKMDLTAFMYWVCTV